MSVYKEIAEKVKVHAPANRSIIDVVDFKNLSSEKFLEIYETLQKAYREGQIKKSPEKERHNDAPSLKVLAEIAKRYPKTKFSGYVVVGREDERFSVNSITIAKEDVGKVLPIILRNAKKPDEVKKTEHGLDLWWD